MASVSEELRFTRNRSHLGRQASRGEWRRPISCSDLPAPGISTCACTIQKQSRPCSFYFRAPARDPAAPRLELVLTETAVTVSRSVELLDEGDAGLVGIQFRRRSGAHIRNRPLRVS